MLLQLGLDVADALFQKFVRSGANGKLLRFLQLIEEGFCNKVATAHHLSDNVETVLLNLFRGSSPSGLKGIPEIAYCGKIIRPILNSTREEIDEYVLANNFEYVVDESNSSEEYSRNFLRLNVIPKIKERFPEMEKAVARFTSVLCEEDEYFFFLNLKTALTNPLSDIKSNLQFKLFLITLLI